MKLNIMDWSECENSYIKYAEIDKAKIDSIIKTAERRINFIKEVVNNIKITKENVSFIIENHYEAIKELLTALLLSKGLRSSNHQCLISYFYKNYPEYEAESNLIQRLSYLRNRLEYYGEEIDLNFYNSNKENIEKVTAIIKNLIK